MLLRSCGKLEAVTRYKRYIAETYVPTYNNTSTIGHYVT